MIYFLIRLEHGNSGNLCVHKYPGRPFRDIMMGFRRTLLKQELLTHIYCTYFQQIEKFPSRINNLNVQWSNVRRCTVLRLKKCLNIAPIFIFLSLRNRLIIHLNYKVLVQFQAGKSPDLLFYPLQQIKNKYKYNENK